MERKFEPKLTWNSSRDDVIEEFYKPALSNCVLYQRLAGYFSSTTFANVANEILNFIESNGRIQLITSPKLSESDKELFEKSVLEKEKILSTIFLSDLKDDPKNIKIEFAKLMAYMLTNEINGSPQLEIKIAIPSTGPGIYHQKIGIFKYKNNEKITFSGSINETGTGWRENIENFTVFRSWGDETNNQGIVDNQRDFNDLWNNNNYVDVFDLPQAVREHMLEIRPKSNDELLETIQRVKKIIRDETLLDIPKYLAQDSSKIKLMDHQKDAMNQWIKNEYNGLLEMATGTGKTFTTFGCINHIQKSYERTVTIIACPQLHLIEQWKNEVKKWNSGVTKYEKIINTTEITCNSDYPRWRDQFERILYDFNTRPLGSKTYIIDHVIVFTSHTTLGSPDFIEKISKIKNVKKTIIIDEVHNITTESSKNTLLKDYDFRLGLSATPVRHLDDEGTQILNEYFHGIVYTLNLKNAIHDLHILCPYNYFPHYVELTSEEMEMHQKLTAHIAQIEYMKKKGVYIKKQNEFDPYLARASIIANAQNKDIKLKDILQNDLDNDLDHTLIYCTNNPSLAQSEKTPKQLERVQKILLEHGVISDSVTWEDKTKDRLHILELMSIGHFDCVTAVGCLDEGIDIPSVKTGIFMASSGNPKQFIQRRGRILRQDKKSGKTSASIYDILVMPAISKTDSDFNLSQRKIIAKEILRHKEFASIADNKSNAIEKIKNVTDMFDIDFDMLNYEYIKNMK